MALQMTVNMDNGLVVTDAYIRVDNAWIFKSVKNVEFIVNYFTRKPVVDDITLQPDIQPFKQETVKIYQQDYDNWISVDKLQAADPFAIGYDYLKTLDTFKDAVDV